MKHSNLHNGCIVTRRWWHQTCKCGTNMQFQALRRITQNYAGITQNYTCFTQISYAGITQILRKISTSYANKLRRHNATWCLRINYAKMIKHKGITQICLRINYAYFQFLRNYITQILRRYYANKLCNHYAIITQINYADITQINYAIITHVTQSLRK